MSYFCTPFSFLYWKKKVYFSHNVDKTPSGVFSPHFIEVYMNRHCTLNEYSQNKHAYVMGNQIKNKKPSQPQEYPVVLLSSYYIPPPSYVFFTYFWNLYPCSIYILRVLLLSLNIKLQDSFMLMHITVSLIIVIGI